MAATTQCSAGRNEVKRCCRACLPQPDGAVVSQVSLSQLIRRLVSTLSEDEAKHLAKVAGVCGVDAVNIEQWIDWVYAEVTIIQDLETKTARECRGAIAGAPAGLKADREFMLKAVRAWGRSLEHACESLRGDKEVVLAAINQDPGALKYAGKDLKSCKDVVLAAVKNDGMELFDASEDLKADREVVLAAVEENGLALAQAHESLKGDKGVVLAAVRQDGNALASATHEMKNDKDVVLEAVRLMGGALKWASPHLQADKDVVLAAMPTHDQPADAAAGIVSDDGVQLALLARQDAAALGRASHREAVLAAVGVNGAALQHAPNKFQDDKDVVLAAVQQNGLALEYASQAMRGNMDVAEAAVKQNGFALKYVRRQLRGEKSLAVAAVPENGDAFTSVDLELKGNKELVLQVVRKQGGALCCASEALRSDLDVVCEAVKSRPSALRFATSKVKEDLELALQRSTATCGSSAVLGVMAVLSLSAGLGQQLTPTSYRFLRAWKNHAFMNQFEVCQPRKSCTKACKACTAPSSDTGGAPCWGTQETCASMYNNLSDDYRPWATTCWRFAVRFYLQECKENHGFMVQIVEGSRLSDVQVTEETLAKEVGIKIFRASHPNLVSSKSVLERISRAVRHWNSDERADMSLQVLDN